MLQRTCHHSVNDKLEGCPSSFSFYIIFVVGVWISTFSNVKLSIHTFPLPLRSTPKWIKELSFGTSNTIEYWFHSVEPLMLR